MFSSAITSARYFIEGETSWDQVTDRVVDAVYSAVPASARLIADTKYAMRTKKFVPGGRILRNAGLPFHQMANCFLFDVEDSREGWGELVQKSTVTLMTGGGVGVNYSRLRPRNSPLGRTQGVASGPVPLIRTNNEIGRGVQCGGFRRSALYASLRWDHPDIPEFVTMKDWPQWLRDQKALDMDVAAPGDMTNISVALNQEFFTAYSTLSHPKHTLAREVYWSVVGNMCRSGEPGFQVDLDDQVLRNACTEIISADDGDCCVIGAVNLARCDSPGEVDTVSQLGTAFLLAVTEYSDHPLDLSRMVQIKNRRLGLGVMGVGEWFLQRNLPYGAMEIFPWFKQYYEGSEFAATYYAGRWGFARPVAVRAVAPTGTISIVAETTSGIEPLFAPAYERRYLTRQGFTTEVVIDPVALRLHGEVRDYAHVIDHETRIKFQAMVQGYVDNGISSTVNLPNIHTDPLVFGNVLIDYLPLLRGITVFPNGSRGLQPITAMPYQDAVKCLHIVDTMDSACPSGVCSI